MQTPSAFAATFGGPGGPYTVSFDPQKDEARLWITSGDQTNFWMIRRCECDGKGWRVGGMTGKPWVQWDKTYWVNVFVGGGNDRVEYWGDKVLKRTDVKEG